MDSEKRLELARIQSKAVGAIRRHVCLETLTRCSPAWYAGMGARVEARAALEQAEGLGRLVHRRSCAAKKHDSLALAKVLPC